MKVTALIPDDLVASLRTHAKGETLTDSLVLALEEWTNLEAIKELNKKIKKKPFKFQKGFTAEKIRNLNRKRS